MSESDVPAAVWQTWICFRDCIAAADIDGRAWWGMGRDNDGPTAERLGLLQG
ncbi:MAG TPA: hypothetical protein VNS81_00675 [Nocardioides sp.]|nr:hypothetical protein [Nocardioides sp.]